MAGKRISWAQLTLYALPALPLAIMHAPAMAVLPAIYAKNTLVTLESIGLIILTVRMFDAVTDPVIGYLSDISLKRIGRKPWLIAGGFVCMVGVYFLFQPSSLAGPAYLLTWYLITYLGWTMMEIPYRAWGSELSRDYNERSRISTMLSLSGSIGYMLFMVVPLLPFFASSEITLETLRIVAFFCIMALPATVAAVFWKVPEGQRLSTEKPTVFGPLKSIAKNKPFWIYLAIFGFGGLGSGTISALLLLYMDGYLNIGDKFALIMLIYFCLHIAATPIWLMIVNKIGKGAAWGLSWAMTGIVMPFFLFIEPGPQAFLMFTILLSLRSIASAADMIVPMSMLGDVIDYDILKTKRNYAANFFALHTLVNKFNAGIGGAAAFILLGFLGFDVNNKDVDSSEQFSIVLIFVFVPLVAYLIASIFLWNFPITKRRHEIIRRRIESRRATKES